MIGKHNIFNISKVIKRKDLFIFSTRKIFFKIVSALMSQFCYLLTFWLLQKKKKTDF